MVTPSADHEVPAGGPAAQPADDRIMQSRPELRSELRISLRNQNRRVVAIIEDPVRNRFFQTGNAEYHFLKLLDGTRTVEQALDTLRKKAGRASFDEARAKQACLWLGQMNLLKTLPGQTGTARLCEAARQRHRNRMVGWFNPVCLRMELGNPDRWLAKLLPWTKWLFTWPALFAWLGTGFISTFIVFENSAKFAESASGFLAPDRWFWLLLIWVLLKIIHEAGHGLACKRFGGDVPRCGVLFMLFAPLAWVDVTSSWRMASKWKRIAVAGAGIYVEMFIAFIAVFFWHLSDNPILRDFAYNIMVMAGVSTLLFNANPLIRFDGYYILSDLTGLANLFGKGQKWISGRVFSFVFGTPLARDIFPPNEMRLVALYGIGSLVWRILLLAGLLLAASVMFNGAGLILAAVGAWFWVGQPVWRSLRNLRRSLRSTPVNRKRAATVLGFACALMAGCFLWLQAPAHCRVPAIVQFGEEHILRAAADGFVTEILAEDGAVVSAGSLVCRMSNPDLEQELEELENSLRCSEIRIRMYAQGKDIAKQQSEQTRADSIAKQIVEKKEQLGGMEVRAPIDGVIFARNLGHLRGRYLKQGDAIAVCADPGRKKVLLSIDQQQIDALRAQMSMPVYLLLPGHSEIDIHLQLIQPSATDVPRDLALTAAADGPLAVRPATAGNASDSGYRYLAPRFEAECELPTELAGQIPVGQRGTALVRGRKLSLGGYWVKGIQDWVRQKLTPPPPDA